MITKQEIIDLSREFSLETKTVEKDYVLGWLLAGIANQPNLFDQWVFKGGTCLKKCYFETFRFSEDLDYTFVDKDQVNHSFLMDCFKQIAKWIYDASGIQIPEETIRFKIYKNRSGREAIEGRVGYIGPIQRRGEPVRIKLDLTADEILVAKPDLRDVHHPYSDNPLTIKANCYSFSEIFAEKLRALSERARPRDLYDVIHLYRHVFVNENPKIILDILQEKCNYKSIPLPTMDLLRKHPNLGELESEWSNMLAHQLPHMPPREQFWEELPKLFDWLYGKAKLASLESIPFTEHMDSTWQPPHMIQPWNKMVPVELIRYAGANHLCVELVYEKETILIEPYNLVRKENGNLCLISVIHSTNAIRSFDLDSIKTITVSPIQFTPQYQIELTPFLKCIIS